MRTKSHSYQILKGSFKMRKFRHKLFITMLSWKLGILIRGTMNQERERYVLIKGRINNKNIKCL